MKINYNNKMLEIMKKIEKKPRLLLHSCCAPCSAAVLEYLREYFEIAIYFYNPNITVGDEYHKRLDEQKEYDIKLGYSMDIIEGVYNPVDDFFNAVKGLENEREGGSRCLKCYEIRMRATAEKAKELGFDYFTTVLSISPLKKTQWINEIGEKLESEYGVNFLYADFKKQNRYLRSVELSKEHDLYRQDYCGCIFSKVERENIERDKNEQ